MLRSITFKTSLLASALLLANVTISSQNTDNPKPKLIVGIVVDQMRFDHLYRYQDMYGDSGFKRIMEQGFNFKNHHYNYIPTVTAAGHASIYTGATPSLHGIVGNSWYDRYHGKEVGNVEDTTFTVVGSKKENDHTFILIYEFRIWKARKIMGTRSLAFLSYLFRRP